MTGFGDVPAFDEEQYHLAIVEKDDGSFVISVDLDGLRYVQSQFNEALAYRGFDHGMMDSQGDRNYKKGAVKLAAIRLFIDYLPRVPPPRRYPKAYRMPGKILEIAIRCADAERIFMALARMGDHIAKGKAVERFDLGFGVCIQYKGDWT